LVINDIDKAVIIFKAYPFFLSRSVVVLATVFILA